MQIDILACTNTQDASGNGPIVRTFRINGLGCDNVQICYFDRYKETVESICTNLLHDCKGTCIDYLIVRVTCHGYQHTARFNNGKLGVFK